MAVHLFTGFPGFIGARLLPRLMELLPGSRFVCLVQERFLGAAEESLAVMARDHPHTRERVQVVTGDITLPRLGMEPGAAADLSRDLAGAWHLAAVYDLAVARDVARRINVDGTRHVLEFLSGCPKLERLHYVSTAYVSGRATGIFRETDLDVGQAFKNHYEETKFLAEVDVVKSGLPATVYRPAIVVGDSRTGETAKFDGPYFTVAAMERVPSPGLFLRVGSGKQPANLVPVDFVIEAMARLGAVASSRGRTYHLTDPDPLPVFEIERLFAGALGKSFWYVPVPPALARAFFTPRFVQRYFGMPVQTLDYFDHPCRYDASQASADLGPLGVRCPRFPDYVGRLVAFYREKRDAVRRSAMV